MTINKSTGNRAITEYDNGNIVCQIDGETELLYYSDEDECYKTAKIANKYEELQCSDVKEIKVISNGKLVPCKINTFDVPIEYEIILINKAGYKATANHCNKLLGKDHVQTKDLTTDDKMAFDSACIDIVKGFFDKYVKQRNTEDNWVKIKEINKVEDGNKVSYCLELSGPEAEPIVTLANGIVIHSCKSDT